ncbi:MAG: hypothetical protein KY455_06830 [Euryarchaeota archaeon]|nr:hypothetical protein [Euryarchaeota archaeon]
MADPYEYPLEDEEEAPKFTVMTLIAIAFIAFMVWQVSDIIGDAPDRIAAISVDEGDTITYTYVARDAETGALIATNDEDAAIRANRTSGFPLTPDAYRPATSVVGPDFRWGPDAIDALEGARAGETVSVTTSGTAIEFTPLRSGDGLDRVFYPPQGSIDLPPEFLQESEESTFDFDRFLSDIETTYGRAEDGMAVNWTQSSVLPWLRTLDINHDNRSVLLTTDMEDGATDPVPDSPFSVTTIVEDGSRVRWRLDAEDGERFIATPDNAGFQELRVVWTSLLRENLWRPGLYEIQDVTDDKLFIGYHPTEEPEKVGRALIVEITILSIASGEGS